MCASCESVLNELKLKESSNPLDGSVLGALAGGGLSTLAVIGARKLGAPISPEVRSIGIGAGTLAGMSAGMYLHKKGKRKELERKKNIPFSPEREKARKQLNEFTPATAAAAPAAAGIGSGLVRIGQLALRGGQAVGRSGAYQKYVEPVVRSAARSRAYKDVIAPRVGATINLAGGAAAGTAEVLLGKERAEKLIDNLFPPPYNPDEDYSLPANPIYAPAPTRRPAGEPGKLGDVVEPGTFVDTFARPGGLRFTGPDSASGRSTSSPLDTFGGGFDVRRQKSEFKVKQHQARVNRQEAEKSRQRRKELAVGVVVSLAVLLAAGLATNKVRSVIRKVRRRISVGRTAEDIMQLVQMGNMDAAQAIIDKEFKNSGVDVSLIASTIDDLSPKDIKAATDVLRQELM